MVAFYPYTFGCVYIYGFVDNLGWVRIGYDDWIDGFIFCEYDDWTDDFAFWDHEWTSPHWGGQRMLAEPWGSRSEIQYRGGQVEVLADS